MLKTGMAFLIGTSSLLLLPELPPYSICFVILPLIVFSVCVKKLRLVAVILCGFIYAYLYAQQQLSSRLAEAYENQPLIVEGVISDIPKVDQNRQAFYLDVEKALIAEHQLGLKKLRLNWYSHAESLELGQRWRFQVKLKRPHGAFNQAGFRYETWLWVNRIDATGNVLGSSKPEWLGQSQYFPYSVRQYYYQQLNQVLEASEHKALFMALAIADKSDLSHKDRQLFQDTGTAHLLAISGLHIGLASGCFWLLGVVIWFMLAKLCHAYIQYLPRPVFAAAFALSGAAFYAMLAGFTLPTTRALIMVTVLLVAVILKRQYFWQQALGLALLLILLQQPFSVLSPGFCMSFLAVFVITYLSWGRMAWQRKRPKTRLSQLLAKSRPFVVIQLALSASMLPLLLLYFGKTAVTGTAANFFAIPFASFLLVPGVLLLLLLLPLAGLLGIKLDLLVLIVDFLFAVFMRVVSLFQALPLSAIELMQPDVAVVVLLLAGILLLLLPRAVPYRWLALLVILPLCWPYYDKLKPGEFRVDVLDVGQGLAVLVSTHERHLLYDTGVSYPAGFNAGSDIILPVLRKKGIHQLDKVMISHGDWDHRGGLAAVIRGIDVSELQTNVVPSKLSREALALQGQSCRRGQRWHWNGVDFEILHPPDYWFTRDNDASCVLRVSNANMSIIIPGDIEWLAEYELVEYLQANELDIRADILISPHHGSRTSSSPPFVDAVSPQVVMHSAGYLNRFKLPNKNISRLYASKSIRQYATAQSGQITIESALWPAAGAINDWRSQSEHFWYWQENQP